MMGGRYISGEGFEWNTQCDPIASQIVFQADVPEVVAYGLDVTRKCKLMGDECRQRIRGGILDFVADMAEVWYRERDWIIFHDPLAGVCMFEPELCTYASGTVRMELTPGDRCGTTGFTEGDGRHTVAIDVDAQQFFDRYFAITGG
jgi:purine nucleosidase